MKLQLRSVVLRATVAHLAIGISTMSGSAAALASSVHQVSWSETADRVILTNDYLELVFDRSDHAIVRLSADHSGKRKFTNNLLAGRGIRIDDTDGAESPPPRVELLERKLCRISVRLRWRSDAKFRNPSEMTLSLGAADRCVHI